VSDEVRVLLVSGSTRRGSTNTAALATAAAEAPGRVTAILYDGLADLPAFNPDDDGDRLPAAVAGLRRQIADADAVLFCTPEYAGSLPGSFKNLLDWTVGGGEIYRKPAAWINVAAPGRGKGAEDALALVLGYVGAAIVDAACRRVPVDRAAIGPDGTVTDPQFTAQIAGVWEGDPCCIGALALHLTTSISTVHRHDPMPLSLRWSQQAVYGASERK
jgi:chromate reductase, NAD(P)H dehydrogenase (quinone)